MTYIRIKKISNNPYAYLVQNISTDKGPRQKVKKYLGRVYQFEKQSETEMIVNAKNKKEFLQQLIQKHLENHGFKKETSNLINNNISFSLNNLKFTKGVIAINQGFLCNSTIENIISFKKTKDIQKDGTILAKQLLQAGLPLAEQEFVQLYSLL
ncbi:MAG TPA: hypothetical protein VJI98_01350 [Candidatus Nanoarchaeia archaeon]|nr:hypothetical protein [Candidatus Nanoarchaeia archaeon]